MSFKIAKKDLDFMIKLSEVRKDLKPAGRISPEKIQSILIRINNEVMDSLREEREKIAIRRSKKPK